VPVAGRAVVALADHVLGEPRGALALELAGRAVDPGEDHVDVLVELVRLQVEHAVDRAPHPAVPFHGGRHEVSRRRDPPREGVVAGCLDEVVAESPELEARAERGAVAESARAGDPGAEDAQRRRSLALDAGVSGAHRRPALRLDIEGLAFAALGEGGQRILARGRVDDDRGNRTVVPDERHFDAGRLESRGDEQQIVDPGLHRRDGVVDEMQQSPLEDDIGPLEQRGPVLRRVRDDRQCGQRVLLQGSEHGCVPPPPGSL
jgi:hypothetical protein